ncbi:MAG: hypothetical protein MTP17_03030 [Candidatus Midichloria sp.]|nr:MAG: hypothetical protein MTP17_03030 [Candidatus Midichloria sp.]
MIINFLGYAKSREYSLWADFAETPLNEEKEIYLVTIQGNSEAKHEAIAIEQSTYFIGNTDNKIVKIGQISSKIGCGEVCSIND